MRPLPAVLGRGLLAGLVAGLLLTTVQALARLLLGVAPPAELLGDRIAPLLSIDQFFGLFGVFGGYNGLKQAGILGGTSGQLAVCVVIGIAVAVVSGRSAERNSARRGLRLLVVLTALFLVAALAVLWPNLSTNYTGWTPGPARAITIATMVLGFASFGAAVAVALRVLSPVREPDVLPGRVNGPSAQPDGAQVPFAHGGAAPPPDEPASVGRRALLGGVGVVGVGLAAATGGMGAALVRESTFSYDGLRVAGPGITPITSNEAFYTVTKNVIDPRITPSRWSFGVDGAVATPTTWNLDELRAMPQLTQETTLSCISNGVGDGLESNAMWTGVPLADLIMAAGPSDDTVEVLLTAVDGYTDTFSVDKALDPTTLLAFGMNGGEVPRRHGFPARLVVPGMYGEKNLKWITRVELVTEERKGFYETQGWGPNFEIPTRSRIASLTSGAQVPRTSTTVLTGTAHGGNRGVARVEVSVDDGRTWTDARITYPGTRLSWALWSFDWQPNTAGAARLVVRATDQDGGLQIVDERGVVPQGATGLHKVDVAVI